MPNPKKPGKQKSSKSSTPPLNHDPFASREYINDKQIIET